MPATKTPAADQFAWETQPAAARWVQRAIDSLVARRPTLERLRGVLRDQTGTRLVDWVDHLALATKKLLRFVELVGVGYVAVTTAADGVAASAGHVSAVLVVGRSDGVGLRSSRWRPVWRRLRVRQDWRRNVGPASVSAGSLRQARLVRRTVCDHRTTRASGLHDTPR
jgi:hypothetical protein